MFIYYGVDPYIQVVTIKSFFRNLKVYYPPHIDVWSGTINMTIFILWEKSLTYLIGKNRFLILTSINACLLNETIHKRIWWQLLRRNFGWKRQKIAKFLIRSAFFPVFTTMLEYSLTFFLWKLFKVFPFGHTEINSPYISFK